MSPPVADADPARVGGPLGRLLDSLGRLLATFIDIGRTRLELLTSELQEEVRHAAGLLVLAFVALLATGMGLLFAGLSLIFIYWDTHRIAVSLAVTAVYFVIAAAAGLVLSHRVRAKPRLLADTLAELERDLDALRRAR